MLLENTMQTETNTAISSVELMDEPTLTQSLKLSAATVRKMRRLGTGPKSLRIGKRVLYRRCDVEAWLDAQAE